MLLVACWSLVVGRWLLAVSCCWLLVVAVSVAVADNVAVAAAVIIVGVFPTAE